VLDVGLDLHTERGRGPTFKFMDPPPISRRAEARDLKFCLHVVGALMKTMQKYAMGGWGGSGDLIPNFGTPHISGMAEARDLTFCVDIEGWGPERKYAKVGHRGS